MALFCLLGFRSGVYVHVGPSISDGPVFGPRQMQGHRLGFQVSSQQFALLLQAGVERYSP